MQFSSALRIAALRGRPSARTISVHIEPSAAPPHPLPEASFEINRLKVDARGRIEMMRLAPRPAAASHRDSRHRIPISAVSLLAHNGSGAMELQAANAEPMNIQLLAAFELLGVELSPSFTLAALVLKARTAPFRITLQSGGDSSGVAFGSAQARARRVRSDRRGAPRCADARREAVERPLRTRARLQELLELFDAEVRQHVAVPIERRRFCLTG